MCTWEIRKMKPECSLRSCAYKNIVFFLIMSYFDLIVNVEDFGIHGFDGLWLVRLWEMRETREMRETEDTYLSNSG